MHPIEASDRQEKNWAIDGDKWIMLKKLVLILVCSNKLVINSDSIKNSKKMGILFTSRKFIRQCLVCHAISPLSK